MRLLLSGHAGAGLGYILIAAAIGALALTIAIFWAVYRSRPSAWLRILGGAYTLSILASLAIFFVLSPNLALLVCWYILAGFIFACFLGLAHLILLRA